MKLCAQLSNLQSIWQKTKQNKKKNTPPPKKTDNKKLIHFFIIATNFNLT